MTSKPVIGITKPDNEDFLAFAAIWAATKLAGGQPVVITAKRDYKAMDIDGLILGGGKDIFPELYKQTPKKDYRYDPDRDAMELFCARKAIEDKTPVLGICRGAQLMNVACGGSLHRSVSEAYEEAHYPDGIIHHAFYRKTISVVEGSLLSRVVGCQSLRVNSIHKQAIDVLGEGLIVNARESNGVVQAIASREHSFFLGIQFHPEFLIYRRVFRKIFEGLIKAAQK